MEGYVVISLALSHSLSLSPMNEYIQITRFAGDQEKVQCQKQKLAEQRREEARVQKQIEVAHREMERLEKYVNIGGK